MCNCHEYYEVKYITWYPFFSSPVHEVQGELFLSHFVRRPSVVRRASCVVNICACQHSAGYILEPISMKVYQNIHLYQILDKFETGPYEVKNWSLDQIEGKFCFHSGGNIFNLSMLKLYQKFCLDDM